MPIGIDVAVNRVIHVNITIIFFFDKRCTIPFKESIIIPIFLITIIVNITISSIKVYFFRCIIIYPNKRRTFIIPFEH